MAAEGMGRIRGAGSDGGRQHDRAVSGRRRRRHRAEQRRVPGWVWASAHYGYLMASTVAIRRLPRRRRMLGATLTAGGVLLDATLGPSRAAPWFAPVFYSKLLLGHASSALWPDSALRD